MSLQTKLSKEVSEILLEAFPDSGSNESFEIIDDSHLHAGHAGAREHGGGHLRVTMKSSKFQNLSRVQMHKLVKEALKDKFEDKSIHALSLKLSPL